MAAGVRIEEEAYVEESVLMPGTRIGPHVQIRQAIIEEGVHIPANFEVGVNVDDDRKHCTVTHHGIVVVSETPESKKPIVVHFRRTHTSSVA